MKTNNNDKKIVKRKRYLDVVTEDDNYYVIHGWLIGYKPAIYVFYDGKKIAADTKRTVRRDVNDMFLGGDTEYKAGFFVTIDKKLIDTDNRKVDLVISDEAGKKSRMRVKLTGISKRQMVVKLLRSVNAENFNYVRKSLSEDGIRVTIQKIRKALSRGNSAEVPYDEWKKHFDLTDADISAQKQTVFSYSPLISIVIPVYNTPLNYFEELIQSVLDQTYNNWQLCLADAGTNDQVQRYMETHYQNEPRISYKRLSENLGISGNTNAAIEMAEGEYIAFADHDDLLTADALFECVKVLNDHPDVDSIYSDEDKVTMDGKEYFEPHFKSDYNIDLLCSYNYVCHLYVVKKALMDKAGILNSEYDGAQDYDFVFRTMEKADHIYHIPRVLYHWRAHKNSTAENPESKMYAFEAGKRAVQAHYDRLNIPAEVVHGKYLGRYITHYHWTETPKVSIVIPNKDHIEDLDKCLQSILTKSTYKNYECIIIENNSTEKETFEYYKQLEAAHSNVRVVYYKGIFNYSAINNFGVQYASGEYLLLLNNDTEVINPDWLEEMLGYCMREDVGIVGARLYYSDDTIQHAGVIIGMGGIAGHTFVGYPKEAHGYFDRNICAQDYSAVTAACLMVKKSVYDAVGGLCEQLKVAFNDVDFCLQVRKLGKLVVYNPAVELHHYESKSRGYEDTPEKQARFKNEIDIFSARWGDILKKGDPYFNKNLSLWHGDYKLKELDDVE